MTLANRIEMKSSEFRQRLSAPRPKVVSYEDTLREIKAQSAKKRDAMKQRGLQMHRVLGQSVAVRNNIAAAAERNRIASENSRVEARIHSLLQEDNVSMGEFRDVAAQAKVSIPKGQMSTAVRERIVAIENEAREDFSEEIEETQAPRRKMKF